MKIAFIFDGQGGSNDNLGKDFYDNDVYFHEFIDRYKDIFNLEKIYENIQSDFSTDILQPSIFLYEIAIAKLLERNGITCHATAGSSLGEYTSICYNGSLTIEDTIKILKKRGSLMKKALSKIDSGMRGIMFLDQKIVEECIKNYNNCEISNINSHNQVVISGLNNELDICSSRCMEMGARKVVKLNVEGAFHSHFLKEASRDLFLYLKNYNFKKGKIPIYYNYTGNISNESIPKLLEKQLYSKVLFQQCIENMIDDGIDTFYEIGSSSNLAFHIKSIARSKNKEIKLYQINTYEAYKKIVESTEGVLV